jgi:phosphoesterase RecJ-like protein
MTVSTFDEIGRVLREHQRFAILSHVRPDGDALGSQLALALSLQQLGKNVRVWNEDGMLEKYSFLPRSELLTKPPSTAADVDVAIALDTAIQNRLGTAVAAIRSAKIWINIDHHRSNPGYGDLVIVDPSAPATGEIIFSLIKSQGLPFNHDIAENLYAAISTDTGSFQYPKAGRARSRSQRNSCALAVSTLAKLASNYMRTIPGAGWNCCGNCSGRRASSSATERQASVSP